MITTVEALPETEFIAWLEKIPVPAGFGPLKPDGARLAKEKGCLACHSLDGSRGVGPTFKGLYRQQRVVRQDGKVMTITADAAYLRESIHTPNALIVDGYQPIMPVIRDLQEEEIEALVEFIEGIK
jgi:cytochrome c oxidase subunit 2